MFSAFSPVGPNRIRENVGLAFEDFRPGQIFHHRPGITITQQDNVNEALATYNQAMIHYDHHYSAQTEFKTPLVVSTLTLQRAIGMGWKTFGRRKKIKTFRAISLTAPVFGGDTLYARSRILAVEPAADPACGEVTVESDLSNQNGKDVAKITWVASVYRRDLAPHEKQA